MWQWQVLVRAALVVATAGQVSPVRDPVRGYAGIDSFWQQAVLVEPTPTVPRRPPTAAASKGIHDRNVGVVSNPRSSPEEAGEDKPTAAALVQSPHLGRPAFYPRPFNGSRLLRQRLRQQMQGRRTGFRRKAAGGLNMSNRRVQPGRARPSSGAPLAKRRRRPVGSLMSLDQWRNASVVLSDEAALQSGAALRSSTPRSKVNDFLSQWHSSYSRSQIKAQDNTKDQELTTEEAAVGESQNVSPQTSSSSQSGSGHSNFGATTRKNKKSTQNLAPKFPYVSPPSSLASIPSVHDMTSMHFKKINDSSADVPDESLKSKDGKSSERLTAKTAATTLVTRGHTKTTPLPTKRSITRASPDGKEILDSIQSIFQAAKTDEQELASMRNYHGNNSPQPLDIFSGISPTFGFVPSDHVQSPPSPKEDTRVSQTQMPPQAREDPVYPTSWPTTPRPYVPDLIPQSSDVLTNALKPQRASGGDLLLRLGHYIPVQEQRTWGPEHREGGAGDIILDSEAADDIIFGRPAALIQAPTGQTHVVITAAPESHKHSTGPLHFLTTEEPILQHNPEEPSPTTWQSQELGPLLDFISTKYKPSHVNAAPPSVMSLQSMINTGKIPEVFRRDQLMDYIREDRLRYRQPSIDRVGEPWQNSVERIRMHPQVSESPGGGAQFVALSSLALLLAFCGYFLFSASGTSRESRGVFPPLKAAVDEAKNGLYLLIQGLDEYEDHLSKEERSEDDKHTEEETTTYEDIPTILRRIWNTLVPPEVQAMSGLSRRDEGGHTLLSTSSLVRSGDSREESNSVSREPHSMEMPKSERNEANDLDFSQVKHNVSHYESVILPPLGLSSVANSFLNSLINSKAIKSIITQLKSPPPDIGKQNRLIDSPEEIEESTPDHLKNNRNSKLPYELEIKDRNSMEQDDTQEPQETTTVPVLSNPDLDDSSQEGLTTFTGTGIQQGGVREETQKTPSARKRVILNNRLHVHHTPETDPPRTSAFVDNVPLRPLS